MFRSAVRAASGKERSGKEKAFDFKPIPDAPCMVPTLGWFEGSMQAYMAYMERLGIATACSDLPTMHTFLPCLAG